MAEINYSGNQFLIKRKFLKLLGADFNIYDASQQQILFAHMKAFKWKEDITLYKDESKTQPVITIRARNVVDFSAAYDFYDSQTMQKIGAAKRKGWKSIFRDEWIIMDVNDAEIGTLKEDSGMMAFLRRFLTNLIPQTFHVTIGGAQVATYKNNINPIISKVSVIIEQDTPQFSKPFALAMGILLCAVEGKQK